MTSVSTADTSGYQAVQDFVTFSVRADNRLIISILRNKFGCRREDFYPFYNAWMVSFLLLCFHKYCSSSVDHSLVLHCQNTKEVNIRHLIELTGRNRRQAMRKLNDLLTRVMETLWPSQEPPVPTPDTPSSPRPNRGVSSSSGALEIEFQKVNQALRNAVGFSSYRRFKKKGSLYLVVHDK